MKRKLEERKSQKIEKRRIKEKESRRKEKKMSTKMKIEEGKKIKKDAIYWWQSWDRSPFTTRTPSKSLFFLLFFLSPWKQQKNLFRFRFLFE